MFDLITASLLAALVLLSSFDGLYLHLWKYRLQERPESQREHLLHSLRAWLFIPFLLLVSWQPAGWTLYGLLGLIGLDLFIGLADVLEEPASRASLGGLSRAEYFLHVVLVMLHSAILTLVLVSLNSGSLLPGLDLLPASGLSARMASQLLPGTVAISLLHIWLIVSPHSLSQLADKFPACCSRHQAA